MSTTIDQKVVEMRFDNKNFESNVSQTMSTLDKFKQKLNLTGASKGLENINTSANKINMNGVSNAIENVRLKFSALEVMGVTALANITNSAVNAGKRIVSALTIDPIKTGFSEYETKINAIQTIMSNTSSKGTTMDDVTKTLNELNTYADKTIYNFAEMTRNIGTFTAAGVGLEDSAKAIQGIANLAAASGSNSQQASTAMYQLSQALASGTVKLMDWNSVVNAGMGGQLFQEALKTTAREHGVKVDAMIKKEGSFRESLKSGWITAEILNETLSKFTVDGAKKYADAMMQSGKWTQAQADALIKEAQSMEDAATKVKTFTQLWSTLQEAAQSGWSQSWEIIIGNFEEAKGLLTEISDVIGGVINKSAESRNKVLQEWKDLGGRLALVDSLRNVFEGISSIVKPIREAFSEIFPPITAKQLLDFSNGLKNLTAKLKISDETAKKIKETLKGVFSVIDIGVTFIKDLARGFTRLLSNVTGITGGILGATAALGKWVSGIRDSVKEGNYFGKTVDGTVNVLQKFIDKVKTIGGPIISIFNTIFDFIKEIGSKIGKVLSESLREGDFLAVMNVFNTGVISSILLGINKFVKGFSDSFKNIAEVLDSFKGILEAYQQDLKAKTLMKIATAIGILAASLTVLSMIKPENLSAAIAAMSALFIELLAGFTIFGHLAKNVKGMFKASVGIQSLASALLVLSVALKILGGMKWDDIWPGLAGLGLALVGLVVAVNLLPEKNLIKAGAALKKLSTSLLIFSVAMKVLGTMSWEQIKNGLIASGSALAGLVVAVNLLPKNSFARTAGLMGMVTSLLLLSGVLKILATMSWDEIKRSLAVMGGALLELSLSMRLMPKKGAMATAGSFMLLTLSLLPLAESLRMLGKMSWEEIKVGVKAMGIALAELVAASLIMNKAVTGSMALSGVVGSIIVLALSLKMIGSMSLESIALALGAIAGAFVILGIAAAVLTPMAPTLMTVAGACALFGLACVGVGVGIALLAAGITALGVALAGGATAIVAGLTSIILGVAGIVPDLIEIFGECIVIICKVLMESAPLIASTILVIVAKVFESLAQYTPVIVTSLMQFLIGVLQSLRDHLPDLIVAAVEVIGAFFDGIVKAMKGINPSSLLQGVLGLTLLTGLIYMLSGIAALIPGAMVGVLGLGLIMAELALVLAAIGGMAQIPGLSWLIEEGGNFLQKIGTAIGQFIGGIAGGIALGATSTLPQVGTNLAMFMTNLKPFIDGVKQIDPSVLGGALSLVGIIMAITAANIIESITSWLTGGSSIEKFASQLPILGLGLKLFSLSIAGMDASAVTAAATAAKAIAEMTSCIPNEGGVAAWFAGENSIAKWAGELPILGAGLKEFSTSIAGMDSEAVAKAAIAAKAIAEMTATIPNEGGVAAWFAGENSASSWANQLPVLGAGLKEFSDSIAGMDSESVSKAAIAAEAVAEMTSNIPNAGGMVAWFTGENSIARFGFELGVLGAGLKTFATSVSGLNTEAISAAVTAAKGLTEMTSSIPNQGGMVAWFTGDNSMAKWASQLPVLGAGLKLFSTSIAGVDCNAISLAAGAAKALSEMTATIPNEGGIVAWFTGDNSVDKWASKLPILGAGLKAFSGSLSGVNLDNLSKATTAAKDLAGITEIVPENTGYLETFGNNMVKFAKKVNEFVNKIGGVDDNNIMSAISKTEDLLIMAKEVASTNIDSVKTFGESLKTLAKDGVSGFVGEFSGNEPKEKAKHAVGEMVQAGIDGADSKMTTVEDKFRTIGETAVKALADKSLASDAKEAGKDLVQGLINGLKDKDKRDQVYNAAFSLGQLAVQGEKDGQQSKSPSKATEKAGKWLGEGLIIGIKEMGSKVYGAGRSMGEEATNSISGALNTALNLLNSDMDSQPQIRPILDLSDVESGMGYLSSMFNRGPSLAVATNLGAISYGMNTRIQNGSNDDVVSAITKLGKSLGNARGDTYNINGMTYDDGSNVADAVKQLYRAARMERRV